MQYKNPIFFPKKGTFRTKGSPISVCQLNEGFPESNGKAMQINFTTVLNEDTRSQSTSTSFPGLGTGIELKQRRNHNKLKSVDNCRPQMLF